MSIQEIQNKYNCYFTYLENKFWANNSILVPKNKPVINEQFKNLIQIFGNNTDLFTEIYWNEIGVIGEIKLPGEWNFCYINEKAFHLIKTKSDGEYLFTDGEKQEYKEFFYYQLIYDDWTNEFLNNTIQVTGNIVKTGDIEKIKNNIHRTSPIIQNVNYIDEFDCAKKSVENRWTYTQPEKKFYKDNSFSWVHPIAETMLDEFLKTNYENDFNYETEKLTFPIFIQETFLGNWKTAVVDSLSEYLNVGVAIYDINKQNFDYGAFMGKYRALGSETGQDTNIYTVTRSTGIKNVSNTYVRGLWLKEIDLSGLSDVIELKTNLDPVDSTDARTWRDLGNKLIDKIFGAKSGFDGLHENLKSVWYDLFYRTINGFIVSVGGRLFTNTNKDWKQLINTVLPRDRYKEFGIYKNIEIRRKEINWDNWTYKNRKFSHDYFWWFDLFKPGEYMTENKYQKNHILYRGVSKYAGSLFMGAAKKLNSTITKKIDGITYSTWKNSIGRNFDVSPDIKEDVILTDDVDRWDLYTDIYGGEDNFDFSNSDFNHKLRGMLHLDKYQLVETIQGREEEIEPGKGVLLMPDYENQGYVLADYETSDILHGAKKKNGINKVFAFSEILDHLNPVKNYDINTPNENFLTGSHWERCSHALRLGTVIKRILLPPEEEQKKPKIRFKRWYKATGGTYAEQENSYCLNIKVPKIPRWSWQISVPKQCWYDFKKILDEYNDVINNNFAWIDGATKEAKGITSVDSYGVPIFELTKTDFIELMELNRVPQKIKNNSIYIFIDVHPKTSATEQQKKRLTELIEKLHTGFFRSPWSENVVYQSSNIPGNLRSFTYKPKETEKDESTWVKYYSLTNFRPYKGIWYCSRLIVTHEFEADIENSDAWYNARKKNNMFTFVWSDAMTGDGMLIIPITETMDYLDKSNYHWRPALTNLYILGQADRIDKTPNGIFTQNAISFQDREGYKWNWRNTRGDWNRRLDRQKQVAGASIFMFDLKNKSHTFTTKNALNPKDYKPFNTQLNDLNQLHHFYEKQNQLIPEYIWKYINPDSPTSKLHNLEPLDLSKPITTEILHDYLNNKFSKKIKEAFLSVHNFLIGQPVIFDLVGTNFLAVANYDSSHNWDFELIAKRNDISFIKEGRQQCQFINYKKDDESESVPKAINSLTEINVYGHKIPLKERFLLNGSNINIKCFVEKIPDKHQSPADWYLINIQTNVDYIRTQIEVPKETTISANLSLHDKQRLFNEYLYNNAERYWEVQKYNIDKDQFFRSIKREEKYQYTDIMGDVLGITNNVLSMKGIGLGGAFGIVGGLLNIGGGILNAITSNMKRFEERAERLEFGTKNFHIQGKTMAVKHKAAEEANLLTLQNLANNNRYPEFNNAIIFEELNKLINKSNIYLTRYSPSGDLLQALKDHYDEYGYDILLNNQTCTGIDDIKKHIQFISIKKNIHNNNTIRNMIEQRLLTGVKVIENSE